MVQDTGRRGIRRAGSASSTGQEIRAINEQSYRQTGRARMRAILGRWRRVSGLSKFAQAIANRAL